MTTLSGLAWSVQRGLRAYLQPRPKPGPIDLGTCVRISLAGGWRASDMITQGVVVEVVPPREPVLSLDVSYEPCGSTRSARSTVPRYVVQTWAGLIVRRGSEMEVDAP